MKVERIKNGDDGWVWFVFDLFIREVWLMYSTLALNGWKFIYGCWKLVSYGLYGLPKVKEVILWNSEGVNGLRDCLRLLVKTVGRILCQVYWSETNKKTPNKSK